MIGEPDTVRPVGVERPTDVTVPKFPVIPRVDVACHARPYGAVDEAMSIKPVEPIGSLPY